MLRIITAFLLLLAHRNFSSGQDHIIRELHLTGNQVFTRSELLDVCLSLPGKIFSEGGLKGDVSALRQKYYQQGYYFAEVTLDSLEWAPDSSGVSIALAIHEGNQIIVRELRVRGATSLSEEALLQGCETRVGNTLEASAIERDLKGIVSRYERIGYPFARAIVTDISLFPADPASMRVEYAVEEGTKVILHEIRVTGNSETSKHVIVRESRIGENELFDEDKVSKIPARLNRLNIFSAVHEPQVFIDGDAGGLLLTVEEGHTNTFDGILGYAPSGGDGSGGFVSGMINIDMRSLFGTARKFHVRWQRDDRYSQEIGVHYTEPWLLDLPVNISAGFFQRQQDSSYVRRVIEMQADVFAFDAFTVGGMLHREDIVPSSSLQKARVAKSNTLLAGLELRFDTRDDPVSPTGGVSYRTRYEIGTKQIEIPDSPTSTMPQKSTVQKIGIDAEFYIGTLARQVAAFGLHGRQLISDNIEVSDYFRFGGTNTLRGYRENQFQGSVIAWTNTEYRFLLARRSFFYGFFDTGYYLLPSDDEQGLPSSQSFLYGYGFGFKVETSLGNIGVSFALGKGDPPSQVKLHIGFMNDF